MPERLSVFLPRLRPRRKAYVDPWEDRDRCADVLAQVLQGMTLAEVSERFERHGIWFEKVQDFDDMRRDPQASYAGVFREVPIGDEVATLINHPIRYDGMVPPFRTMPLRAGGETRQVLSEIGYDEREIDRLVAVGAVGDGEKCSAEGEEA